MSSSRRFKFSSPGIFLKEIDRSNLPAIPPGVGPTIIGRLPMGPGMRPMIIQSFDDYVSLFGQPEPGVGGGDQWRDGNSTGPTYAAYAAQAYLRFNGPINVIRLLGEESSNATAGAGEAGWVTRDPVTDNAALLSDTTGAGAYGLFICDAGSTDLTHGTGTLAAVFYCGKGAPLLNGRIVGGGATTTASLGTFVHSVSGKKNTFRISIVDGTTAPTTDEVNDQTFEFNFTATDKSFVRRVFNTNPTLLNGTINASGETKPYWLGETFENDVVTTCTTDNQIGIILGLKAVGSNAANKEQADYRFSSHEAKTPWVVSQHVGVADTKATDHSDVEKLFRLVSMKGGEWPSKHLKVSIANIKASRNIFDPYGRFDIIIRKSSDIDTNMEVLERFTNLSLNPKAPEYIAKRIGDQYLYWSDTDAMFRVIGDNVNRSNYFRVEVSDKVKNGGINKDLIPFGFYGPPRFKGFSIVNGATTPADVAANVVGGSGPFDIQTLVNAGTATLTVDGEGDDGLALLQDTVDFSTLAVAIQPTGASVGLIVTDAGLDGQLNNDLGIAINVNGRGIETVNLLSGETWNQVLVKINAISGIQATYDDPAAPTLLTITTDKQGTAASLTDISMLGTAPEIAPAINTSGTGFCEDFSAVTATELAAAFVSELTAGVDFTSAVSGGNIVIKTVEAGALTEIDVSPSDNALLTELGITTETGTGSDQDDADSYVRQLGTDTQLADAFVVGAGDLPWVQGSPTDVGVVDSSITAFSASFQFPSLPLRKSTTEVSTNKPENVYFGIDTEISGTTLYNASYGDINRPAPNNVATNDKSIPDTNFGEYAYYFTLDNVSGTTSQAPFHAAYVEGSRKTEKSLTAAIGLKAMLRRGHDSFTMPVIGGHDGLNILEQEPFGQHVLTDASTEETNYAYYTVNRALSSVADKEEIEMNLLTVPGVINKNITKRMIDVCETRGDSLAIIDLQGGYVPSTDSNDSEEDRLGSVDTVIDTLDDRAIDSSYGCAYYPWVQIADRFTSDRLWVPPSVVALGTLGSSETRSELWFAPAGFVRGGLSNGVSGLNVLGVRQRLTSKERDELYEANINPIASFPAEGIVVFGQKTLQVTPSALDRINVRRLMIFIKREITRMARDILFDQNVNATWQRFLSKANPFLTNVKIRYGLTDFLVVLDESTTTPDLIDRNILYAKVYVKPARAIEYIAVDFVITNTGAEFS